MNKELVNHPSHYSNSNIECIEALIASRGTEEVKAFCLCNAIKYLWRLGKKDSPLQEAKKVQWYINKFIELSENGNQHLPCQENLSQGHQQS